MTLWIFHRSSHKPSQFHLCSGAEQSTQFFVDLEIVNVLYVAEGYACCRYWSTMLQSSSFAKTPGSLISSRTIPLDHLRWCYNLETKGKMHLEACSIIILSLNSEFFLVLRTSLFFFFVAAGIGRGNSSTPWALAKVVKGVWFIYYICNSRKWLASFSIISLKTFWTT